MRPFRPLILPALSLFLGMAALSAPAQAEDDPAYLTIGAGGWEIMRGKYTRPEGDLAFRSDYRVWALKPQAGLLFSGDGDHYAYWGLLSDIYFGRNVVLTPSASMGYYGGAGFNLGSHFEFREGGEIAYRFEDSKYRVGAAFYHISNGDITQRNPGSEIGLMTLSVPIGRLFNRQDMAQARAPKVAMTQFSLPGPVAPEK